MKKKGFKSLIFALLLTMLIVPLASASDLGPIEPLVPVPTNDVFEAVNESFDMWFVEFRSPPVADGGNLRNTQSDKANFRSAAAKSGLVFEERFAFDTLWNGISLSINPQDVAKLANLPGIKGIYPVASIPIPETTTSEITPEMYTALAMTGADVVQTEMGYTGEGIKVAIMDTGIDYDHPDLGGCFGEGCRVYTGWDFVGDAFTGENEPMPGPDPDDCNGHGTHVAGIVGASGVVTGVAPDVTFGAYRVFGCTGYTWADIMLAAMEMALEDGMHILNMSIGSAFQWPQYPTAVASDNLVKKGMVVVASIGNSGAAGIYSAGAPGVGEKVIGVASFDNTDVYVPYFEVGDEQIGYIEFVFSPPVPTEGTEEIVFIGQACNTDELMADPEGKVALAVRGACNFSEKALNAINAGATGVVIHNNAPGIVAGTLGAPLGNNIPVVGISQADGMFIRDQEEPVYMTWTDQMVLAYNPTGGLISGFSSYGLAPDLSFKPDLGAPGGSIYSTYPLEGGGYAVLGGTSMSSPHVAGAVALLLQANPRLKAEAVRGVLQNSAEPKDWWGYPGIGYIDNVHRQGAGMLQIDQAIMATTTITPAKLALGESEAGPVKQNIKLTNSSRDPVTYDLSFVNALSTGPNTFTPGFFLGNAWVEFQSESVTLPGRGAANINVTIHPATGPEHGLYGGYIVFTPQGGGQVLRVPYAGFIGDYQGIQAMAPGAFGLPALGWTPNGVNFGFSPPGDVFTMVGYDIPYLLIHFAHPSQLFRVEIVNAQRGRLIHPVFNTAFYYDYLPRNSTAGGFFAFGWDGYRMHKDGHLGIANANLTGAVPDGEYQLVVHVLKANGQANNPAHWETWTSPMFVIDRP